MGGRCRHAGSTRRQQQVPQVPQVPAHTAARLCSHPPASHHDAQLLTPSSPASCCPPRGMTSGLSTSPPHKTHPHTPRHHSAISMAIRIPQAGSRTHPQHPSELLPPTGMTSGLSPRSRRRWSARRSPRATPPYRQYSSLVTWQQVERCGMKIRRGVGYCCCTARTPPW